MNCRSALCVMILSMSVLPQVAWAAEEAATTNAAVVYKQAFASVPQEQADRELLDHWQAAPLDAASNGLLNRCEPAFKLLAKAAALKECDWNLNYTRGLALQLPWLGQARLLAEAGALRLRQLCEQKKFDAASKLAAHLILLDRRVGTEQVIVARLVGFAMEQTIDTAICRYLPDFPAESAGQLLSQLKQLPAVSAPSNTWVMEGRMAGITIRHGGQGLPPQAATAIPKDSAARAALAKEVTQTWERAAKLTEGPLPDAVKRTGEIAQIVHGASPAAREFLSGFDILVLQEARNAEARDLFEAAVDMQANGAGALSSHRDPFGDGPFTQHAIEGGVELQGALLFNNKPVTLTTGPRAFQ